MEAFVRLEPTDDDEKRRRVRGEKEGGGQEEKKGWGWVRRLGKMGRKVETVRKRIEIKLNSSQRVKVGTNDIVLLY